MVVTNRKQKGGREKWGDWARTVWFGWWNNIKEAAARNSVKEPKASCRPWEPAGSGLAGEHRTGGRAENDETKSLINAVMSAASVPALQLCAVCPLCMGEARSSVLGRVKEGCGESYVLQQDDCPGALMFGPKAGVALHHTCLRTLGAWMQRAFLQLLEGSGIELRSLSAFRPPLKYGEK